MNEVLLGEISTENGEAFHSKEWAELWPWNLFEYGAVRTSEKWEPLYEVTGVYQRGATGGAIGGRGVKKPQLLSEQFYTPYYSTSATTPISTDLKQFLRVSQTETCKSVMYLEQRHV